MSDVFFSIITPSFNQGEYIESTINSVLNQTYKNFEYIILDACSTDNTQEILRKYQDNPNIRIIIEKDKGQSDAINKGFKLATGKLVGWINSDDILKEDCLENIFKAYQNNMDASIFYGFIDFIDDKGDYLETVKQDIITYDVLLNEKPDVAQPGSFYNLEYVKKVGYLDETLHFAMDYDLWLRLMSINKAVRVEKVLAKFRLQTNSKTVAAGNSMKFWKDIFYVRKTKHKARYISKFHINFLNWAIKAGINKTRRKLAR